MVLGKIIIKGSLTPVYSDSTFGEDNSTLVIKFAHALSYRTRLMNLTCQLALLQSDESRNVRIDLAPEIRRFSINGGSSENYPPGMPMIVWLILGAIVDFAITVGLIGVACVFRRRKRFR